MLTLSKALWIASLAAQCALVARLISERLVRRAFPFFTAYLVWGILSGVALVWIPFGSSFYARSWLLLEPGFAFLGFASVWECYRRAVAPHSRSDQFFVLAIAGALALTFCFFTITLDLHWLGRLTTYFYVVLLDRIEASGSALFLGGLWLVFRDFPVARKSNTGVHWLLLFLLGVQNSVAMMIIALSSGRLVNFGNAVSQASSIILYVLWAIRLSAAGEVETPVNIVDPDNGDDPLLPNSPTSGRIVAR